MLWLLIETYTGDCRIIKQSDNREELVEYYKANPARAKSEGWDIIPDDEY